MTKLSQKVFYLTAAASPNARESVESKSLLLGRDEVFDSTITMRSQKAFYSAAPMSLIRP